MSVSINVNIIITYSLAIIVLIHSYKFRGLYKSLLLFFGSWVVGGGIENANTIFDGYFYPGSELTWFWGECPFDVILGWYVIIYCSSYMAHAVIGKFEGSSFIIGMGSKPAGIDKIFLKRTILRAALAGYIAISLDFLIDPVAVANGWWVWKIHNIYLLGVPVGNYLGWWLLIFWGVFFYDFILTYSGIRQNERWKTSAMWATGTIIASLVAGLILMAFTYWWSMEGIRTEGLNTHALDTTITPERLNGIVWAVIIVVIAIGAIMASAFLPERKPKPPSTQKTWLVLPAAVMLVFWAVIMVVAASTGPEFLAIGVLFCAHYVILCLFIMVRPKKFFQEFDSSIKETL